MGRKKMYYVLHGGLEFGLKLIKNVSCAWTTYTKFVQAWARTQAQALSFLSNSSLDKQSPTHRTRLILLTVKLYDILKILISDKDPLFHSHFCKKIF